MNHNKITNVTDGEVSPTSKEAINGSQLYEATKEVRDVSSRVERLDDRVDKVGAHAAALAAFYPLDFDRGNKLDLAVGTGSCRGNTALAIGAFYRPDNRTLLSLGGSTGGENMWTALAAGWLAREDKIQFELEHHSTKDKNVFLYLMLNVYF